MLNVNLNSGGTITVVSDTCWSCKAIGNFTLSKYSGNKNISGDTIDINIPDETTVAEGTVLFSSGKGECNNKELTIFLNNNYYISTIPNYVDCGGEKTIYFTYESPNETFNVAVNCFDGWSVSDVTNVNYIKDNNSIMVISGSEDSGQLTIIPEHYNSECSNKITIKLVKVNS